MTDAIARPLRADEISDAAHTLAGAFFDDPVWAWVFDDEQRRFDQHLQLWSLFLVGSVEYGWVWVTDRVEAVALWIPPGCDELPPPYEDRLAPLGVELLGERAGLLMEVFDAFETAHPRTAEHFYLSLLGTDPSQRGRGIGMALLRDTLARIDELGAPAYLESSNPTNNERYASVGFERHAEFALPADGPAVTTMWRRATD